MQLQPIFKRIFITISIIGLVAVVSQLLGAVIMIPAIQVTHSSKQAKFTGYSTQYQKLSMRAQGAFTTTDFLNKQGNVQITEHSSQQTQSAISLRGFGENAAENVLVLIDDIPLTSFTTIGPNINSLLVDNIQSIDVMPGSYGVLYGDGAIGGVVNIITAVPEASKTNVTLGIGNNAQSTAQLFFSRRLSSDFSFSAGGLFYATNHDQPHNQQTNQNLNVVMNYETQRDVAKLIALIYRNQIQIPQALVWNGTATTSITNNYSITNGQSLSLQNYVWMSDRLKWDTSLLGQATQMNGIVTIPFTTHQQSLLWDNRFHYSKWLETGFTLQGQEYALRNQAVNSEATALMATAFVRATIQLLHHLDAIIGARYAYQGMSASPNPLLNINTTSNVPVNEEGLVWHINPRWKLYLRHDSNYRFASANEKVWVPSNVTNLKTQTGNSYETGLHWDQNNNVFSLGFYWLDLDNEIAYDPIPTTDAPFGKVTNLPPTRRLGVDASDTIQLNTFVSLNGQVSVVDAYFRSGNYASNNVPGVSLVNASVNVTYAQLRDWSVSIGEVYHSSFYAAYDLLNAGDKMPGYFITNFNVVKEWRIFEANLEVNNLLNKHYVRFAQYNVGPPPSILYYPSDGISVLFRLSAELS